MTSLLFNLLSYRPTPTGLSRYVERLLKAWSKGTGQVLPMQLRVLEEGQAGFSTSDVLPKKQSSYFMRWLQSNALVQHGLPTKRLLQDIKPELIYSPYTDRLLSLPEVPQVITCHDLIPLFFPNSRRAYWRSRLWLPRHLNGASRIIAISRSVADLLIQAGISSSRIEIVYNGVEAVSNPITKPVNEDILVIARHARNKNLRAVLEGFACFLKLEKNWDGNLVIVGTPDRSTKELLRLVNDLSIQFRVRWISSIEQFDLEKLIRRCFCLISSSFMEGFDYPLFEAQAHGLPTLASDINVHRELHDSNALLFSLGDGGKALSFELRRLARDRDLWKQLSKLGVAHVKQFSLTRQVQGINHVLQSMRN